MSDKTISPPKWKQDLLAIQCQIHPSDIGGGCAFCATEMETLLRMLRQAQMDAHQAEARVNYAGSSVDPASVTQLRLQTLIDMLFGHNPKIMGRFEVEFSMACVEALGITEQEVLRAKLMAR